MTTRIILESDNDCDMRSILSVLKDSLREYAKNPGRNGREATRVAMDIMDNFSFKAEKVSLFGEEKQPQPQPQPKPNRIFLVKMDPETWNNDTQTFKDAWAGMVGKYNEGRVVLCAGDEKEAIDLYVKSPEFYGGKRFCFPLSEHHLKLLRAYPITKVNIIEGTATINGVVYNLVKE